MAQPLFVVAAPAAGMYRRRRVVAVTFLIAFVVSVAVAVGALVPSGRAAPADGGVAHAAQRSYLVQPGDTLWAVAELHRGQVGQADYVALMVEMNGGARIEAGELIVLP